jgi:hypothetical protein
MADTLVPSASAGLGATDQVPSGATVVVRSGVPSPSVSTPMVAPGSPVPETSVPEATSIAGAEGATASTISVADVSFPSASVAVTDTLVPSARAGLGATDQVPSAATVVVRSGVPSPSISTPIVAPGSPVPEISAPEATATVRAGATASTVSVTAGLSFPLVSV